MSDGDAELPLELNYHGHDVTRICDKTKKSLFKVMLHRINIMNVVSRLNLKKILRCLKPFWS